MYQKLFDHLNKEFDILATQDDMETICNIVKEIEQAKLDQARKERKNSITEQIKELRDMSKKI